MSGWIYLAKFLKNRAALKEGTKERAAMDNVYKKWTRSYPDKKKWITPGQNSDIKLDRDSLKRDYKQALALQSKKIAHEDYVKNHTDPRAKRSIYNQFRKDQTNFKGSTIRQNYLDDLANEILKKSSKSGWIEPTKRYNPQTNSWYDDYTFIQNPTINRKGFEDYIPEDTYINIKNTNQIKEKTFDLSDADIPDEFDFDQEMSKRLNDKESIYDEPEDPIYPNIKHTRFNTNNKKLMRYMNDDYFNLHKLDDIMLLQELSKKEGKGFRKKLEFPPYSYADKLEQAIYDQKFHTNISTIDPYTGLEPNINERITKLDKLRIQEDLNNPPPLHDRDYREYYIGDDGKKYIKERFRKNIKPYETYTDKENLFDKEFYDNMYNKYWDTSEYSTKNFLDKILHDVDYFNITHKPEQVYSINDFYKPQQNKIKFNVEKEYPRPEYKKQSIDNLLKSVLDKKTINNNQLNNSKYIEPVLHINKDTKLIPHKKFLYPTNFDTSLDLSNINTKPQESILLNKHKIVDKNPSNTFTKNYSRYGINDVLLKSLEDNEFNNLIKVISNNRKWIPLDKDNENIKNILKKEIPNIFSNTKTTKEDLRELNLLRQKKKQEIDNWYSKNSVKNNNNLNNTEADPIKDEFFRELSNKRWEKSKEEATRLKNAIKAYPNIESYNKFDPIREKIYRYFMDLDHID